MQKAIEVIARGVILDEDRRHILFCSPKDKKYYYLPGGHIEFGETAIQSLKRELIEETGIETDEKTYDFLGITEEVFIQNGEQHHEVNLYFKIPPQSTGASELRFEVRSIEEHISFTWLPADRLNDFPLLPASIVPLCDRWANEP